MKVFGIRSKRPRRPVSTQPLPSSAPAPAPDYYPIGEHRKLLSTL